MVGSLLYYIQEKMLFLPTELTQDYKFRFSYPFEELFLKTGDNAVINSIHFKAKNSKGVILYFHGNAGDLSRWGITAEYFVARNYDVFVLDYRTYGKSKGELNEEAFYSDAQLCYDYLKKQYSEDNITIYGRSLGTGIATNLASNNKPKQLILESPYYSITDVAQSRFPMFPVEKFIKYKFPSFQFISDVDCYITIFHGTDDLVIPFESAIKLFNVSPKEQTNFVTIEGGDHNNLIDYDDYHLTVSKILP